LKFEEEKSNFLDAIGMSHNFILFHIILALSSFAVWDPAQADLFSCDYTIFNIFQAVICIDLFYCANYIVKIVYCLKMPFYKVKYIARK
jgi:hypothetical protein